MSIMNGRGEGVDECRTKQALVRKPTRTRGQQLRFFGEIWVWIAVCMCFASDENRWVRITGMHWKSLAHRVHWAHEVRDL
jgi:hypothetical protein